MPTLTTLVSFNGTNGSEPSSGLVADSAGDLFGTTYAVVPWLWHGVRDRQDRQRLRQHAPTLVSFNGADGAYPFASLTADSAGDLFGTTTLGGAMAMARCSRSPRPPAATPARRPHWLVSTTPTGESVFRSRRRQRWGPVRHDLRRWCPWLWHGVRDRQDRQRLRQHAHHTG